LVHTGRCMGNGIGAHGGTCTGGGQKKQLVHDLFLNLCPEGWCTIRFLCTSLLARPLSKCPPQDLRKKVHEGFPCTIPPRRVNAPSEMVHPPPTWGPNWCTKLVVHVVLVHLASPWFGGGRLGEMVHRLPAALVEEIPVHREASRREDHGAPWLGAIPPWCT